MIGGSKYRAIDAKQKNLRIVGKGDQGRSVQNGLMDDGIALIAGKDQRVSGLEVTDDNRATGMIINETIGILARPASDQGNPSAADHHARATAETDHIGP